VGPAEICQGTTLCASDASYAAWQFDYHRLHGLNLLDVGANTTYQHKCGLGYAAPWISLSVAAARDDYRGDIRDGRRLDIRAEIGKRFTPEFDASFGGRYDRRYGRNDEPVVPGISGNVFDLRGESVYARAAERPTPQSSPRAGRSTNAHSSTWSTSRSAPTPREALTTAVTARTWCTRGVIDRASQ